MRCGSLRAVRNIDDPLWLQAELDDLDNLANILDDRFKVPGTNIRFGLDSLVGLIPGIGDVLTSTFSLYLVSRARSAGASRVLVGRMLWNIFADVTLGSVPIVGDIFDVTWKSNRKNIDLLRKHLQRKLDQKTILPA